MNKLMQLQNRIAKGNPEVNTVRTLFLVMNKVGGYEQLMDLSVPAMQEIIKCMEWENKEQSKGMRRRR